MSHIEQAANLSHIEQVINLFYSEQVTVSYFEQVINLFYLSPTDIDRRCRLRCIQPLDYYYEQN